MTTLTVGSLQFDARRIPTIPKDNGAPVPGLRLDLSGNAAAPFTFIPTDVPAGSGRPTGPWRDWLPSLFPAYADKPFAPFHAELWDWVWQITPDQRPAPFVALWARGFGKSTSAELACVAVGARESRKYALYVSATQEQADKHVDSIAAMLESGGVERRHPQLAARMVGKYGNSRGWRRSRLRTASGFTVDAIGLDTAARGIKVDEQRPDLIILDDIDNEQDRAEATAKKVVTITQKLLPAGSDDLAVLAIQNLMLPDGVFARLAKRPNEDGGAGFLRGRVVSGPHPAVEGLEVTDDGEFIRIVGGTPTWAGKDLATCEAEINGEGLTAFLVECQHEVEALEGAFFRREWWTEGRHRYHESELGRDGWITTHAFVYWDTASEESATAAYSAGVVGQMQEYGVTGRRRLILRHVLRGKWELPELLSELERHALRWDATFPLDRLRVEYASSGVGVVQTLKRLADPRIRSRIGGVAAREPKDMRARSASVICARGHVWLPYETPENRDWLRPFEDELYAVPRSKYRDQTDAWSHMIRDYRSWWRSETAPKEYDIAAD